MRPTTQSGPWGKTAEERGYIVAAVNGLSRECNRVGRLQTGDGGWNNPYKDGRSRPPWGRVAVEGPRRRWWALEVVLGNGRCSCRAPHKPAGWGWEVVLVLGRPGGGRGWRRPEAELQARTCNRRRNFSSRARAESCFIRDRFNGEGIQTVDANRIYLMGNSSGGGGRFWGIHSEVSGALDGNFTKRRHLSPKANYPFEKLKNIPVFYVHGDGRQPRWIFQCGQGNDRSSQGPKGR